MMTEMERMDTLADIDTELAALRVEWRQVDQAIVSGSTDGRLHERRTNLQDRIGELVQQRERISHGEV